MRIHPKNLDLITLHHAILVLQTQKMPKDGKPLGPKKMVMGCFPAPSIAIVMSASDVVRKFISQPVDIDLILNIV
jgi:hypothetical protein